MGSLGHQDHPNDEHNEALALLGANEDLTNTVDVDIFYSIIDNDTCEGGVYPTNGTLDGWQPYIKKLTRIEHI